MSLCPSKGRVERPALRLCTPLGLKESKQEFGTRRREGRGEEGGIEPTSDYRRDRVIEVVAPSARAASSADNAVMSGVVAIDFLRAPKARNKSVLRQIREYAVSSVSPSSPRPSRLRVPNSCLLSCSRPIHKNKFLDLRPPLCYTSFSRKSLPGSMLDIVDRNESREPAPPPGVFPLYGIVPRNRDYSENACFAGSPM